MVRYFQLVKCAVAAYAVAAALLLASGVRVHAAGGDPPDSGALRDHGRRY